MVDFPIKTSICKGFSIAMLNNQMVCFAMFCMYDFRVVQISDSTALKLCTLGQVAVPFSYRLVVENTWLKKTSQPILPLKGHKRNIVELPTRRCPPVKCWFIKSIEIH